MENSKKMSTGKITLIIIAVLTIFLIFFGVGSYNSMVKLKEKADNQSSNIDTQLKRRSDLIPNLLNTVKGSAAHETEVIDSIAKSREKLAGSASMSDKAQADSELTGALNRLLMVVENYPDLKANANFTGLMDELSGTENRISVARKDYNDAAMEYNQKIKTFPMVVVANMFGFQAIDYFQASENDKEVPSVNFG